MPESPVSFKSVLLARRFAYSTRVSRPLLPVAFESATDHSAETPFDCLPTAKRAGSYRAHRSPVKQRDRSADKPCDLRFDGEDRSVSFDLPALKLSVLALRHKLGRTVRLLRALRIEGA